MNSLPIASIDLRRATIGQLLDELEKGRVQPQALAEAYGDAIGRFNPEINAYLDFSPSLLQEQASAAARRRRDGRCGRLDGIPIAVKDNFDMSGWTTRGGFAGPGRVATEDSEVVARLRASGAVLLGKTNLDEGALGATGNNPHYGPINNPHRHGYSAGGSSGGSAAAVAAGLAAAAVGSDSLGSIRIPASYCGVYALKPTHGEISTRGLWPAARRLDAVGLLARGVEDLAVLLQVLTDGDADEGCSGNGHAVREMPAWKPGQLRSGFLPDLAAVGGTPAVIELFESVQARLRRELGERHTVDFSDWNFARTRRAGFMLMVAEMQSTFAEQLADREHPVSPRFRAMSAYAKDKSASDYAVAMAGRTFEAAEQKMRRVFAQVDVLVLPTTLQAAFPLDGPEITNQADLTSFANLTGCPAVSLPMGTLANGLPVGLQLIGARGTDRRLLELAAACAAVLDPDPRYPAIV